MFIQYGKSVESKQEVNQVRGPSKRSRKHRKRKNIWMRRALNIQEENKNQEKKREKRKRKIRKRKV